MECNKGRDRDCRTKLSDGAKSANIFCQAGCCRNGTSSHRLFFCRNRYWASLRRNWCAACATRIAPFLSCGIGGVCKSADDEGSPRTLASARKAATRWLAKWPHQTRMPAASVIKRRRMSVIRLSQRRLGGNGIVPSMPIVFESFCVMSAISSLHFRSYQATQLELPRRRQNSNEIHQLRFPDLPLSGGGLWIEYPAPMEEFSPG